MMYGLSKRFKQAHVRRCKKGMFEAQPASSNGTQHGSHENGAWPIDPEQEGSPVQAQAHLPPCGLAVLTACLCAWGPCPALLLGQLKVVTWCTWPCGPARVPSCKPAAVWDASGHGGGGSAAWPWQACAFRRVLMCSSHVN